MAGRSDSPPNPPLAGGLRTPSGRHSSSGLAPYASSSRAFGAEGRPTWSDALCLRRRLDFRRRRRPWPSDLVGCYSLVTMVGFQTSSFTPFNGFRRPPATREDGSATGRRSRPVALSPAAPSNAQRSDRWSDRPGAPAKRHAPWTPADVVRSAVRMLVLRMRK